MNYKLQSINRKPRTKERDREIESEREKEREHRIQVEYTKKINMNKIEASERTHEKWNVNWLY